MSPRAIVAAVLALGIAATLLIYRLTDQKAGQVMTDDFDRIAAEAALRLEARLHGFEEALHASAGFVMGSDQVTPEEWRRFEVTLQVRRLLPGATEIAYLTMTPGDSGAGQAAAEACRTGQIAAYPVNAPKGGRSVVLLRAVYRVKARALASVACGDSLAGLVMLRFSPATLTQSLSVEQHPTAVYRLALRGDLEKPIVDPDQEKGAQFRAIPFWFAGRDWLLTLRSLPLFDQRHARRSAGIVLLAGLIITALAGALAGSEAQRRRLAREAVSSMQLRLETTTSELGQSTAHSREVEGRLAGLIDSAMDAILSLDQRGRIQLLNPAAERMLRCCASDAIGQPVTRLFPSATRELYQQEMMAFAGGATQRCIGVGNPVIAQRFDGEEFPIEATLSLAGTGENQSYIMIVRDVSDRLATEQERRLLEAQLRQSQKMEAIGTLAGGIAHDFNNILGSILGNAELADQDLPEGHSAREFLSEISRAGERARDLVRRILGFTRQQDQLRKSLRLEQVAEEVAQMVRAGLPAAIDVTLTSGTDLPPVLADASQMHQVLMNLVTNSAQAIGDKPGSIRLTLRRVVAGSDTSLPVALVAGDCLEVAVSDSGAGMGPGVLERMFDPFFTTKPVGQGTGLGLSVVHGIVQQHDGVIRVSSAPGLGTTVRVLLPGLGEEPETPITEAQAVSTGHGERILLVDDEEALLLMNARILRRLGYFPVTANGPGHALRMIEEGQEIDLVLTDLTMPGMSGIELAARLLRIKPELPIVLLTGYGLASSPEELRAQGIRAVLPKPVAIRALAETLAAAIPVHV